MRPFLQKIRSILIPRSSQRELFVLRARLWLQNLQSLTGPGFGDWIRNNEPDAAELERQGKVSAAPRNAPWISLLLPVRTADMIHLPDVLKSIFNQSCSGWELVLLAPDALKTEIQVQIDGYAKHNSPIKLVCVASEVNLGAALKNALTASRAELIALLTRPVRLAPFALFEIAAADASVPHSDLFYSDEDSLDPSGSRRIHPVFKPAFSIDILRGRNYLGSFLILRNKPAAWLSWEPSGITYDDFFDLILRSVESARAVTHIPQILFHQIPAAADPAVPLLRERTPQVVSDHLTRLNIPGSARESQLPGLTRVDYSIQDQPKVSILIPNQDHSSDLARCIDSILTRSSYQNFEILILENNSQSPETFQLYQYLTRRDPRIRLLTFNEKPFNFSRINNFGAAQADGSLLLFLNNDMEVITPNWLEIMLGNALRPEVGAVGVKLIYPYGLIQHAGIVAGLGVVASHYFVGRSSHDTGYQFNLVTPQNLSAVTGACILVRKINFELVSGFDDRYGLGYGDIDLCLKLRNKGFLIVWTPYAELIHRESITRGYEDDPEKMQRFYREAGLLRTEWQALIEAGDPYYNPNLTLKKGDFSIQSGKCNLAPRTLPGLGRWIN